VSVALRLIDRVLLAPPPLLVAHSLRKLLEPPI
jgi:hypothetical protein